MHSNLICTYYDSNSSAAIMYTHTSINFNLAFIPITYRYIYIHILQTIPPSPFLLNAQSLHEFQFSLKTLSLDPDTVLVSAVDKDKNHLVGLWMLEVITQKPAITRAFQITLPVGKETINEKVPSVC